MDNLALKKIVDFLFYTCIFALLFTSIFDPQNTTLSLKIGSLTALVCLFFVNIVIFNDRIDVKILIWVIIFSIIFPVYGLIVGLIQDKAENWRDAISPYFLSILPLLFTKKNYADFYFYTLNRLLFLLAILIILIYIFVSIGYNIYDYGIFSQDNITLLVGTREYGGVVFPNIYYITSCMLIIAESYFISMYLINKDSKYFILASIVFFAYLISGSRFNILSSIILPFVLVFYKNFKSSYLILITTIFVLILLNSEILNEMLSMNEKSNLLRFSFLIDYQKIFEDPTYFIFGQGLGANYNWIDRGIDFKSELTYLEIFRTFGAFMGCIQLLLLLLPLTMYRRFINKGFLYYYIAYMGYLIGAFFNPLLFSSSGIIVLSGAIYLALKK